MRRQKDEYHNLNRNRKIGNKLLIAAMIGAVFFVGIGCLGKTMQENKQITMSNMQITMNNIR